MDGGGSANGPRACHYHQRQEFKQLLTNMNTADHHPGSDTRHQSLFVQQDEHYNNEQPTRRRRVSPPAEERPTRFAGDGLDFRRPVMSQSYIDLTREDSSRSVESTTDGSHGPRSMLALPTARAQRLPRYERNIISIGSDEEEEQDGGPGSSSHAPLLIRNENVQAQERPQYSMLRRPSQRGAALEERMTHGRSHRAGSAHASSSHNTERTNSQSFGVDSPVIDLTNDNDDDVVVTDTRYVGGGGGGVNLDRPEPGVRDLHDYGLQTLVPRLYERLREERLRDLRATEGHNRHAAPRLPYVAGFVRRHGAPVPPAPQPPPPGVRGILEGYHMLRNMVMDYAVPGFDLGLHGGNRPPSPKYEPPNDAAPGFTRTPAEDEVVVCPNCGDELAMGPDEIKQELWVIRACGHAYCGVCARSGLKPSKNSRASGKGKARATDDPSGLPPLKFCVVSGCPSKVSKSTMIRIYSS